LNSTLQNRFDENLAPTWQGHIPLGDAFFAPEELLATGSVDPYLRGLFAAPMKKPTPRELINDELTENLFNRAHEWCNLSPINEWHDLRSIMSYEAIGKLRDLYGHPGNIDLFAGGIAEERLDGALVGPTFSCIIAEQFRRVRDGDRFWYEREGVFSESQKDAIEQTSLARIICDNADNINMIQVLPSSYYRSFLSLS
uniref:Peroxidase n=1 Tax=Gongylonema pulchrum TaxID=637853 RepID=A0A183D465_9BILA